MATGTKGFFTIPHFDGYAAVLVALRCRPRQPAAGGNRGRVARVRARRWRVRSSTARSRRRARSGPRHPAGVVEAQQDPAVLTRAPTPTPSWTRARCAPSPGGRPRARTPKNVIMRRLDHARRGRRPPPARPGAAPTTARTASAARTTNSDQLSPPGAMGTLGSTVPVGHPEGLDHLVPRHAVALARVQLAEVAALHDRAEGRRAPAHHRTQTLRRLDRTGQHRGVQGRRLAQLAALVEAVGQGRHLAAPQVGQPRAALQTARRRG